ncbi:MAG: hypothetical protein AAFS08_16145 [Pseudomonadota bacterium]
MILRLIICVIALFVPRYSFAASDTYLTLIVNRDHDSAVYYLAMPADDITGLLATDPHLVFSDNGAVPIDQFRQYGSFELADEVFAKVTGTAGEKQLSFEAMSMMVHPLDQPQPFATPWDGVTAISVCTVDYGRDSLFPSGLQLYYGAYTDGIKPDEPLKISFPATGREAFPIVVHRFHEGRHLGTDRAVLEDGGTLVLTTEASGISKAWFGFAALLMICTIAGGKLRHRILPATA